MLIFTAVALARFEPRAVPGRRRNYKPSCRAAEGSIIRVLCVADAYTPVSPHPDRTTMGFLGQLTTSGRAARSLTAPAATHGGCRRRYVGRRSGIARWMRRDVGSYERHMMWAPAVIIGCPARRRAQSVEPLVDSTALARLHQSNVDDYGFPKIATWRGKRLLERTSCPFDIYGAALLGVSPRLPVALEAVLGNTRAVAALVQRSITSSLLSHVDVPASGLKTLLTARGTLRDWRRTSDRYEAWLFQQ